jgi:hypothetical protein
MAAATPPPPAEKKKHNPPGPPKEPAVRRPLAPGEFSWWFKGLLSLWAAWHVTVVFLAPLSIQPSSELVSNLAQGDGQAPPGRRWSWVRLYTDPLYLNHGYHFFAPDPPVNNLVRYTVTDAAGATIAEGEFPNRDQQWPRLFYHRHMMLADQAGIGPDGGGLDWLNLSLRGYARALLRRHNGAECRIDYVRHEHLSPYAVLDGVDANSPDLFKPITSLVERAADLETPLWTAPAQPVSEALPPGEPL